MREWKVCKIKLLLTNSVKSVSLFPGFLDEVENNGAEKGQVFQDTGHTIEILHIHL
jgi:hypothetical protein